MLVQQAKDRLHVHMQGCTCSVKYCKFLPHPAKQLRGVYPCRHTSGLAMNLQMCAAQYELPSDRHISPACQDLLARILKADPLERISIADIAQHPWFTEGPAG